MRSIQIVLIILLLPVVASAQEGSVWSLQRCIRYAIDHNISIKQDSLNARLARYTVEQSRLSQIPSISASGTYGKSFGRSINPTTNQFVEGSYNSFSASGTVSALIFGGLQVRNNIERNKYNLMASVADLEQLKNDVSLNVANSFLVAVLAKEQINISKNQVDVTSAQLAQTRAFAAAGRVPELNVAQLESQLATDSSNLINSIANFNASILDLKALLNLDFAEPFTIEVPETEVGDELNVSATSPAEVFDKARGHFGSIKASQLRVDAARKGLAAARGGIYPQLSAGYQVGTNYASNYQSYTYTPAGLQLAGVAVDSVNGNFYNVYQPAFNTTASPIPFSSQFDNNLRHSVYVNLNIPILNGWQTRYNIQQARVTLETQKLNEFNAELTLKQNVYKAHNNAINAIQKYYAAKRANEAATRALDFAKKRYDLGLTSTVDLLVTQSSKFNAASNMVIAKYDLIFKLKVIDYYLGKEIKL